MSDVSAWLSESIKEVEDAAENDLIAAAEEGGQAYHEIITTRGTGNEWARKWWKTDPPRHGSPYGSPNSFGDTPGRVHTGHMRDSQGVTLGDKFAEVGFVNGYDDYFEEQEVGFVTQEGYSVEGMAAQADVHMVIDNSLEGNGWRKVSG